MSPLNYSIKTMRLEPRTTTRQGFTLIELLVVIAIIGILAAVVLASLNTAREKSRNASYLSQVREYQKALELHYSQNGSYPVTGIATWACIGTGHQNARCYNSASYAESSASSVAFRNAMDGFIDSSTTAGPKTGYFTGSMYLPRNSGKNYTILMLFEGPAVVCPMGVYVANASLAANNVTRCDYTHPL